MDVQVKPVPIGGRRWPKPVQSALIVLLTLGLGGLASDSVLQGSREGPTSPPFRIDLNRAPPSELLLLPGVGPQMAQRIELYRRDHGPFQSVDDLRKVPGIGPALLERIRPKAEVGMAPAPLAASAFPLVEPPAKTTKAAKVQNLTELIDINRADLEELQRLPGIGPKMSQRIVDERAKKPFEKVGDLRRVPGIGPKTMEKLKAFIKV